MKHIGELIAKQIKITGTCFCEKHNCWKNTIQDERKIVRVRICPVCSEENDKRWVRREGRKGKASLTLFQKKQDTAGIPLLFQEKGFEGYNGYRITNPKQKSHVDFCRWFCLHYKTKPGFVMIGNTGTGKTHLAIAILNRLVRDNGEYVLFTEQSKFFDGLHETIGKSGSVRVFKSMYRSPEVLVIDQIKAKKKNHFDDNHFDDMLNDRLNQGRPTILISSLGFDALIENVGEGIIDKLSEAKKPLLFKWEGYGKTKYKQSEF